MPGITGAIGPTIFDRPSAAKLNEMVGRLANGPPDLTAWLKNEQLGAHVAWADRREADSCCRPVWNGRRDICLVFFGDDYGRGNDLESLVRLYEKIGKNFLLELNGCFSGLLLDLREQKVLLFNDRFGLNRIYYHQSEAGFLFSSEAKSLLAVLPQARKIDPQSLAEVFSVGCVLQDRSLFKNIALLPAAAAWTFYRDGRIDRARYFDPAIWERQERLNSSDFEERLADVFSRVVARRLKAKHAVGMSLTGGLDSRMILAWAKAPPGSLPCYTFGGPYRDCADVLIARQLAGICQQPHTTLRIGQDFFAEFPRLAEETIRISDGTMDVSGAVELYVNRLAREIGPVRITGNYGSEILRSHIAFRPGRVDMSLFTFPFRRLIEQAAETYRTEATGNRLSFIAFKQIPWHHYARSSIEKSQLVPRSPFLDNELVALAFQAPSEDSGSAMPLLRLIEKGNPALASVGTDRALRRNSLPLFGGIAKAWQEFTAKAEYAYDYGMPQWLVNSDRVVSRLHLEKLFLGRHKFYHFRIWYRDRLREYLTKAATIGSQTECYRDGAIGNILSGHLSGRSNHTLELHKLLTLQLIENTLLRSP